MKTLVHVIIFFGLIIAINAAATHKHMQHAKLNSKERTQDGSYSPLDIRHDEHGDHHTEFDHEVILGSVKEAAEFDTLSPEQSKNRLEIIVKKMDYNQDSYVSRHELKSWILRSFKKLSDEDSYTRFMEIDINNDEQVTWKEYYNNVYGEDTSSEGRHTSAEEISMMEDDMQMFNGADFNKDGILTSDEYVYFQTPEEHPLMLPIVLNHTLKEKDKNKDGNIDFKEYIGDSAETHDKEWLLSEKTKFDEDFDANKDGVLTGDEVLTWAVPSNDEVATEEVDHLFAASDRDHDNRLSYKEILDNYDIFVGSEATDYGDQLHTVHFEDEL